MGRIKISDTNFVNAVSLTDASWFNDINDYTYRSAPKWCGTAGGTANALTITPVDTDLSPTAYLAGQAFTFKAGASPNSAATTVNVAGIGAIAVQSNGAACVGGEILANQFYMLVLDTLTTAQLLKIGSGTSVNGALLAIRNFGCQTQALTSISNATPAVCTCTSAAHLPEVGMEVQFTTSGTLPTGLSLATTYYVTNPSGSTYNVCTTYADALAATNKVATSGAGSGTHTMNSIYTKNASSSYVIAEVWGAGGGSAGSDSTPTVGTGGGGAGGYSRRKVATASLASTETITIGAGGAAGTTGPGNGGTGGTTSFGTWATATGGSGSLVPSGTVGLGAAGGVGASGDLNLQGAAGANGSGLAGAEYGGLGGATTLGGNAPDTSAPSAGSSARNNSGSGAGGSSTNTTTQAGGLGGSGRVIVWEYS